MEIYDYIATFVSPQTFYNVCSDILKSYQRVPYHSRSHGSDVLRTGFEYLRKSVLCEKVVGIDLVTFVFALLGHDAGHPGLGNQSEIERIRSIYSTEHSHSLLEQYHYDLTISILEKHEIVFNPALLHAIIMATDPALSMADARREFPEDLQGMEVIVKLADVNHTVSSFEKHIDWSLRFAEEIGVKNHPNSQIGFLENHVLPIVLKSKPLFTDEEMYLRISQNYTENMLYWKERKTLVDAEMNFRET